MGFVPDFLLKKLYVPGSLVLGRHVCHQDADFCVAFSVKNSMGPGNLLAVEHVILTYQQQPLTFLPEHMQLSLDSQPGQCIQAAHLVPEAPLPIALGQTMTCAMALDEEAAMLVRQWTAVAPQPLLKLTVKLLGKEVGPVALTVQDQLRVCPS